MSSPARARLAAGQADLVRALVGRGAAPGGIDEARVRAAAEQLRTKRAFAVERVWPGLARGLGDRFEPLFSAFARRSTHPRFGHGLADGREFARALDRAGRLPDDGRLELLAVDLRSTTRRGRLVPRRGIAVGVAILRRPRRIVIGVRAPWIGERWIALASPSGAR